MFGHIAWMPSVTETIRTPSTPSSSSCVACTTRGDSAKCRHQSPEWTILSHSYCLIQWEIVWFHVLLDSLHPRSSRTSRWFPPVLRRGSSYDTPGICLVWHSCNMAEQRKTLCLGNSRQAGLPPYYVDETIQLDLKFDNLSLNEAISVAENHLLWRLMSTFGAVH